MLKLLMDIAPYPREWGRPRGLLPDTVDTVSKVVEPYTNGVQGGGHSGLPYILGGILAALVALGFLIFMVRSYRQRGEQALSFNA